MDYGQVNNPQLMALQNQVQSLLNNYNQLNKMVPPQNQQANLNMNSNQAIQFVYGIDGANKFLKSMGPNTSAAVFDHDNPIFYMLSVDANGVPAKIKIGKFTLEDAPEPESDVITKKDFDIFKSEIRAMLSQKNQGSFEYKNNKQNKQGGNLNESNS